MSELVADCPRCGSSKITFNLLSSITIKVVADSKIYHECFCVCKNCHGSTVFVLSQRAYRHIPTLDNNQIPDLGFAVNDKFLIESYVSLKNAKAKNPPEFLPKSIDIAFREAARCLVIDCYNASAAMYRLCLDMATIELLPINDAEGLNTKIRRSLGFRMKWLFSTKRLPEALTELSNCIRDDGNDGAHKGTLDRADAEDLHDFTFTLLERLYTEPERLKQAKLRRDERRNQLEA